jgi:hypothetical protein
LYAVVWENKIPNGGLNVIVLLLVLVIVKVTGTATDAAPPVTVTEPW